MANIFTEQRMIDSRNRTLIKITGILDGSGQVSNTTVVDVSTLQYAMNANNMLMVSNTHPKASYRTSIRKIIADIGIPAGCVKLEWQGNAGNNVIAMLGPGFKEYHFDTMVGAETNEPSGNSVGDIQLSTFGAAANGSYTIIIDLKKNMADYQSAFPGT